MSQEQLAELLQLVHDSHLSAIKGENSHARAIAVEAAKLAARLESSPLVMSVSQHVLHLHALFSGRGLLLADRLAWTASYIAPDIICPPLIDFPNGFSSHDGNFVSTKPFRDDDPKLEVFPTNQLVPLTATDFDSWEDGDRVARSLTQDLLTNCSVVSSMILIISSSAAPRLLLLISPNAPSSKYHVKLYFNGRMRLVTLDSRIPESLDGRMWRVLGIVDWPALIEKAILKIMGEGYSSAGSNMAIDTLIMTGWIPEIVSIESEMNISATIDNALLSRCQGMALVGMGTGTMSAQLRRDLGLTSDHDYSVVDYDSKKRVATLRNPWSGPTNTFEHAPLSFINHLYINWNPSIFLYSAKVDFVCRGISSIDRSPQYVIPNPQKTRRVMWLLLERHIPSPRDARIQLTVYRTNHGERVLANGQYAAEDSLATCNRTQLVKVSVPPMSSYTAAVFCSWRGCMTLSVYSDGESSPGIARARSYFAVECPEIIGEWTRGTSGGNAACSTFVDNPQYWLQVHKISVNVQLALLSDNNDTVGIHVVADSGHTPFQLTDFDASYEIGQCNYTSLASVRQLQLLPGKYRLILATQDPHKIGRFRLQLNHDGDPSAVKLVKVMPVISLFTREFALNKGNPLHLTVSTSLCQSLIIVRARCYNDIKVLVPARISIDGVVETAIELHSQYADSVTMTVSPYTQISITVESASSSVGLVTIGSDTELDIS